VTPSDGQAVVPVFYATDRDRISGATLDYGSTRSPQESLLMGRYDVSIPRDHQLGSVERPSIWTLYAEDPAKHFVITNRTQQSYDDFYNDIRGVVDRSARKDAFVFVHGFNVAFEDAIFRTAQIAYDLAFDGAPILYSWPSNTGENPIGYTAAQNNNDWTVGHLEWFLRDVTAKTGATRVHLIAHSMGNRALVNALNRLPRGATKSFNQIVLTAPDIDAQTFVQLADAVKRNAERATLYASASDKALVISKQLNAYPRAGDTGPGVVVVPGIDTIDVTDVDSNFIGHFYYGDNRSVISDIYLLLTQGLPPTNRPTLRLEGAVPKQFWRFMR
jgi:esterase/lipase superfamily enzyme